ncbi:MAG: hypothetical protein HYV09_21000 [Deltaproteobacteria bacterium]|nr:hypothetical protein [Deltaproteobacteria bacterium]
MIHPSGAEGALAIGAAAVLTWVALFPVALAAIIGSLVAAVQLQRRLGSTINLVLAATIGGLSAAWELFMIVVGSSALRSFRDGSTWFVLGPGALMTLASAIWLGLAVRARARRSPLAPRIDDDSAVSQPGRVDPEA